MLSSSAVVILFNLCKKKRGIAQRETEIEKERMKERQTERKEG